MAPRTSSASAGAKRRGSSRASRPAPITAAEPIYAPGLDFLSIVESLPDIVYALDLEGRFTYLSARAYDLFGYERRDAALFIGRPFMDVIAPGTAASVVDAILHRVEQPHDRLMFRIDAKRKDGRVIPLEVHGGPLWQDGRVVGRLGVCRVIDEAAGNPGPARRGEPRRSSAHGMQEERMRIARGLRDAIAQIVFGVTPDRDATEAFLVDVKRATRADLARRLNLDDVDMDILRLIARGASNREIGPEVHLSAAAVKDRIRRLMTRLGARRRAELAAHALRLGVA